MTKAYTKTVKFDDGNKTVKVGATKIERDFKNSIYAEPIAQDTKGADPKNALLNLQRVKRNWVITAKLDDPFSDKVDGSGDKEQALDNLLDIYLSQEIVTLTIGPRTHEGFLKNLNVTEKATQDGTTYTMKIEFIKGSNIEETQI